MTEKTVLASAQDGVLTLTLNRPKSFNSMSFEVLGRLLDAFDDAADDPEIRVILLNGAGDRAFCAGHDLKEIGADRRDEPIRRLFERCSQMMTRITTLPQPVIACVDGIATAAGCQLVAACDLAVCTERSSFATSGVKYGLFCSTPMVALSRNVPRKAAMEMLLTGDFVSSAEALRTGLVNRVAPDGGLDEAVEGMVVRLLDKPADVLAMGKRAFYEQLEMGLSDAYVHTTNVIVQNAVGESFGEGLSAFVEKRKPSWADS